MSKSNKGRKVRNVVRNNVAYGMIMSGTGKRQVFRDRRMRRAGEHARKDMSERMKDIGG